MHTLTRTEDYVTNLMLNKLDSKYSFHNLYHITQVVDKALELATIEKISNEEIEILLLAAWFHDTGFIYDARGHEESGCTIATEFLSSIKANEGLIASVCKTILCTRLPQKPVTRVESILCDADLHHLGSPDYPKWSKLLLRELQSLTSIHLDEKEWVLKNIAFFQSHQYFTEPATRLWQAQKMANLQALRDATLPPT